MEGKRTGFHSLLTSDSQLSLMIRNAFAFLLVLLLCFRNMCSILASFLSGGEKKGKRKEEDFTFERERNIYENRRRKCMGNIN